MWSLQGLKQSFLVQERKSRECSVTLTLTLTLVLKGKSDPWRESLTMCEVISRNMEDKNRCSHFPLSPWGIVNKHKPATVSDLSWWIKFALSVVMNENSITPSGSFRLDYLLSEQTNELRKVFTQSLRVASIHKFEPNSPFPSYVQRGAKVEDNKFRERWWWNYGVSPTNMPHVHLACSIHFRLWKYSDNKWWTTSSKCLN